MKSNIDGWTSVKSSTSRNSVLDAQLVLNSMGIATRIERGIFEWRLLTSNHHASFARLQLDMYYQENLNRPAEVERVPVIGKGIVGAALYLAIIWVVFIVDWMGQLSNNYAGVLSPSAVQDGAWWLTITSLTLHANIGHIVANSVSGAFFGFIASRYLGNGFAWLLILLCGAFGNYLNAWLKPDEIYSIGASTSCFAAAGIVAGFVWRRNYIKGASSRINHLPLAAAVGIFVFFGMVGEDTDVLGHLMGLACGLVGGVLVSYFDLRRLGKSGQKLMGLAALSLIFVAWGFVS